MQICKSKYVFFILILFSLTYAFSKEDDSVGSMTFPSLSSPEIKSPSMPSIDSLQISDMPFTTKVEELKQSKKKSSVKNENTAQDKTYSGENNKSLVKNIPSLTAVDIASLGQTGLLQNLTGLDSSSIFGEKVYDVDTDLVLQNLLSQIEDLKKKVDANEKKLNDSPKTEDKQNNPSVSSDSSAEKNVFTKSDSTKTQNILPKILRFKVNGYDILKTCQKIYISDIKEGENFLLTGDRKYMSNKKLCSETFYMLFKHSGHKDGQLTYKVEVMVNQDSENVYSFIYQLAQKNNLTAKQTGNLITLRTSDADWKLDFLIDTGSAK